MSLPSHASHVELPTSAQIAKWSTVDEIRVQEDFGLSFYQLLSEVKKIDNTRKCAVLQPDKESENIDTDSDTPYNSSDSKSSRELSIVESTVVTEKAHSEDRETDGQANMPESLQPYASKSVLRSPGWTVEDALQAADEEFWCRNPANDEKDFIAGVCRPQSGDPGYHLWHELRDLIPRYFAAAEKSEDKRTNYHPMTKDVIDKATAAIDALYGDKTVVVDGEKVHWGQSLPSRVYWIVDRFCTASHGWNPILANAAARLGILKYLDILEDSGEPKTSVEADYGPVQGDVQDDSSESGSSIKDDDMRVKNEDGLTQGDTRGNGSRYRPSNMGAWRSFENDNVLEELKKGLGNQSERVEKLENEVTDLKKDNDQSLKGLQEESMFQNQKVGQLEHTVNELTTKVDNHIDEQEERHKKHIDEQGERHKKQLEEVEKRLKITVDEIKSLKSSVLHQSPAGVSTVTTAGGAATESVEDVFSSGIKPSTTKPRGPPSNTARGQSGSASLALSGLYAPMKSSSPLGGGQASRKRKASAQTGPTPTRTFTVGGRNNSQGSSNRSSPLTNHGFSKTDPRLKELLIRRRRRNKETSEEEKTKEKKANEKTPKQDGK